MRKDYLRAEMKKVPFMLYAPAMDSLLEMANSETPRAETVREPNVANNSVVYKTVGSIAVISVDGGMYKKDVGGMCQSVVSYPMILAAIDKAELDPKVETIFFRVDTPGGSVAGADEVEERIFDSKKKTITFFENIGASGGIYIFMASDEVYASETTMLGSIGVKVSYIDEDKETKERRVSYVSENAQNKDCSLSENCQNEIQSIINTHEKIFYDRVMKNTGFTKEKIKTTFNNGGVIFAKEAQKSGFIRDVVSFKVLMDRISINSGSSFVPTASRSDDTTNTSISQQGVSMEWNNTDPQSNEAGFKALVANKASMQSRLNVMEVGLNTAKNDASALSIQLDSKRNTIQEKDKEIAALKAEVQNLQDTQVQADTFRQEVTTRLQEADQEGVSMKTAIKMVEASSPEDASALAIQENGSDGRTNQDEDIEGSISGVLAYAEKHKGSIR